MKPAWLLPYAALMLISLMAVEPAPAEEAGDDLIQMIVTLLGDEDKDVRSLGLEQVRTEAKGAKATKQFAAQLPKLSADAQVGLLSALADRSDTEARPAVVELLNSSSDDAVRVAAINALGPLGQQADMAALIPLLTSNSPGEKAAARKCLEMLKGDKIGEALAVLLKDAAMPQKVALIEILAVRRDRSTLGEILPAATDPDPKVRAAAMAALGELAGAEQIAGIVQGVLKSQKGTERDAGERTLALVCRRIPGATAPADSLLAVMEKMPDADRIALLPALGRIGGPPALAKIESAIADADPQTHAAGMRALCNWPDASIAPRLVELAEKEPLPEHRALALGAVIRVAPLADKRTPRERLELLKKAMTMATKDSQRNSVLKRAAAVRTMDSLRFIVSYLDQPAFSQQACESVVELAHHRELREPNKAEFHPVLDKVVQTSRDATVKDRAQRYKNNQTWVRPTPQK
ncbi:MAG: HEAT repeat domain-containing protein [Planctomycetes bacterium]|nr:HEAT repeat domain-containing protein [Planctomycetota bacterium]